MLCFDIDGVFLSDMTLHLVEKTDFDLIAFRGKHILPIFQPQGEYALCTGRPKRDYQHTRDWVRTHFKVQPVYFFHDREDTAGYSPEIIASICEYKASVLEEHPDITVFVENTPEIIAYLTAQRNRGRFQTRIVDFPALIQLSLSNLLQKEH